MILKFGVLLVFSSVTNAACINGCLCEEGVCNPCDDSGYNGNLYCKKCPFGCLTCADGINFFCLNYTRSIGPQHDRVISCEEPCQMCDFLKNEFICNVCPEKFYPTGRHCNACDVRCLTCTEQDFCEKCHESCLPCPSNCASCTSQSLCTQCRLGYYGLTCENRCSDGCIGSICNKQQGHCSCKDGRYGQYCDRKCPQNCTICLANDKCLVCKPGLYGTLCEHRCPVGCLDDLCKKDTGVCSRGCNSNFEGDKCDRCQGKLGEDCDEICPKTCIHCFMNKNCTTCADGYFGEICENMCSDSCKGGLCTKANGECLQCKRNFYGRFCENSCLKNCVHCYIDGSCAECVPGYYGNFCNISCPKQCHAISCNHSGFCLACMAGFFGDRCEQNCFSDCCNETCNRDGSCLICNLGHTEGKVFDVEKIILLSSTCLLSVTVCVFVSCKVIKQRRNALKDSVNRNNVRANRTDESASGQQTLALQTLFRGTTPYAINERSFAYEPPRNVRENDTENGEDRNDNINSHIYSDPYVLPLGPNAVGKNIGHVTGQYVNVAAAGQNVNISAAGEVNRDFQTYEQLTTDRGVGNYSAVLEL